MAQKLSSITKKPEGVPAPLSLAQRRLWFLYQLDPQSPEYNISRAWRLKGSLNTQVLETSLNLILARHEILRTTFQEIEGQPVQVIQPTLTAPFQERDCSYSPAQLEAEIDRFLIDEPLKPFDLRTGPLLRFTLMRCSPDDHVLVFTVHHMVFDGTSLKIFCQELSCCYAATVAGQPSPLAPLPIQYQDFSYWQEDHVTDEKLGAQLAFWTKQLQGAPLVLELPSDGTRPKNNSGPGSYQAFTLAPQVISNLKQLIQPQGITMFMALLAVFQILLTRYTGQRDILIGTPIAGRTHTDLEDLIGFLVNTLVLRTQILGQPTFHEVLRQVRKTCLGAYRHQDLPFEKLVEVLKPVRDPSRYPVVQAIFQLRQLSDRCLTFPEIVAHPFPVKKRIGNFDLHMVCEETESGIHGFLYYSKDLFSDTTMARFAEHYQLLLEELLANPQRPIWQVPFLTEAECHQQLVEWNDTATAYPDDVCIPDLFEAQVEQTPDAMAVVFGEDTLTYAELNARANCLAHQLRQQGISSEHVVGVVLPRSIDFLIGLLGIVKAGGAYLPIDPTLPSDRIAFMVTDAQASVVVTHTTLTTLLPAASLTAICLDAEADGFATMNEANLLPIGEASNLVYVIYTSGSTGAPKGVQITHSNLLNLVSWHQRAFEVVPSDRATQVAGLSFDATVWELWPYLLGGACVVLAPEEEVRTVPEKLRDWLVAERITISFLPTSMAESVLALAWPDSTALRFMLTGGDQLHQYPSPALPFKLVNNYGPTENTVVTTSGFIEPNTPEAGVAPSIGRPIANTQVYVLDRTMQPVPVGVYGELHIGGDGLARVYVNQPALTAEKFVPHPFSEEPGARLYKTGDVVRYGSDGTLEFKGRQDHQVKVRGYRIELGEIETTLAQHPKVEESVVVVREDAPGDKRVVAYVVQAEESVSPSDLRHFLKQTLPEYMVPAIFVTLEALPLAPNGKVDRRGLPLPNFNNEVLAGSGFTAPRTIKEEVIAEVWADVLGLPQVSVEDNFFDLGGHSLLATKIISRLQNIFHLEFPLRYLLETPTVAGLACRLQEFQQGEGPEVLEPIPSFPHSGTLPLSFTQERFWLLHEIHGDKGAYNVPIIFRLYGQLKVHALHESFQTLVDRHEILRTTFASIDGQPQQIVASKLALEVLFQDLPDMAREEQSSIIHQVFEKEWRRPIDLEQDPLIRVRLYRFSATDHLLVLNLHHIIHDAWSTEVMIKELVAEYSARCEGRQAALPSLPIQYADYAQWQRQRIAGAVGQRHLAFWKEQLANLPDPLPLPTDFPRPADQNLRGTRVAQRVSPVVTERLRALNREEGTTVFMVLLAAFQFFLHRYTGEQDILVGTLLAGRERPEVQNLLGCFLNTLVLRTKFSELSSGRALIQRVREVCLSAYSHQEVPFEKLLANLELPRYPNRSPVFQVAINMHTFADRELPLTGLKVIRQNTAHVPSHFDMTLFFQEFSDNINLYITYRTDLFAPARMEQILHQINYLLEQLVSMPDQALETFSMFQEEDRARLTTHSKAVRPTQPFVEFPDAALAHSIPARFEAQVQQRPEQVAVQTAQNRWTYADVNQRANQIAHTLLSRQFPMETRIALLCAHDAPMIAAILGVLKAGYTYVPLDPFFPLARLETIVADAQVEAILVESTYLEQAHALEGAAGQVLSIEQAFQQPDTSNPHHAVSPDMLAYVLYTSGTTGVPKGVMQRHSHVLHHIRVYTNNLHLNAEDRLTLLATYGFDAAVMDLFGALLNGATLYPLNLRETDPASLSTWLKEEAITIYHSTPTVYRYWTQALDEGTTFPALRLIVLGGEVATHADFEVYKKHFRPDCLFVNGLGPTESTVSLQFIANHQTQLTGQTVPVGHPVAHTDITLLDQNGKENEVYGEIAIRSPYVAVGYWQQPELTQNVFDPTPDHRGARQYRTGDLGRRRPDGSLEFVGRKDTQVKVRGHRIELGEIEAVLGEHPEVESGVVVCQEETNGENVLVAYLIPAQEGEVSRSNLRSYLKEYLPEYMVPNAYVQLEALPLTPNGKIDRQALPLPDAAREKFEVAFVAPRTPIEVTIAAIWQEVLKLDRVGIHDNFFDLGGHSLLATRVVARMRESLHVDFKLLHFFQVPTLKELAGTIEILQHATQHYVSSTNNTDEDRSEIVL